MVSCVTYQVSTDWNYLPENMVSAASVEAFKQLPQITSNPALSILPLTSYDLHVHPFSFSSVCTKQ